MKNGGTILSINRRKACCSRYESNALRKRVCLTAYHNASLLMNHVQPRTRPHAHLLAANTLIKGTFACYRSVTQPNRARVANRFIELCAHATALMLLNAEFERGLCISCFINTINASKRVPKRDCFGGHEICFLQPTVVS